MKLAKRLCIVVCIAVFTSLPVSAHTISVMVVETGLRGPSPITQASKYWESGFMDALFNAGHIVSNEPIVRITPKPEGERPQEIQTAFDAAVEGQADYFILILLDYQELTDPRSPAPQQISLKIYKVNPYEFVLEQEYTGRRNTPASDEVIHARDAARGLLSRLE
ncbi:hypothetical protein FACS189493_3030 [Spirochaetia bacterium]|nr:hypothetical protein FACS189493_3030 [Spirochaetia bacterium]